MTIPYSGKVWQEECFGGFKVWQMNQSIKELLIVTTTLDGFGLANCRQFTKFAQFSTCQTFLL